MSSFVRDGGVFSQIPGRSLPQPLIRSPEGPADLTYTFQGRECTLADFMAEHGAIGLLVLRDGEILVEEYRADGPSNIQLNGFSLAKFVVSLLVGAAIRDGNIESVDDPITRYLPIFRGTSYEEVTLRNLLQMTTGLGWMESYRHPRSHLAVLTSVLANGSTLDFIDLMKSLVRVAPPGRLFNYSSGDVQLAGLLVTAATGRSLGEYLSMKIWVPCGMEEDAYWRLSADGKIETAWCDLYASLRDWGRVGLAALNEMNPVSAKGMLADGWMTQMTTAGPGRRPFGYLAWLWENGFSMSGLHGQCLHIDPQSKLVVVIVSRWPEATSESRLALQNAFVSQLLAHHTVS